MTIPVQSSFSQLLENGHEAVLLSDVVVAHAIKSSDTDDLDHARLVEVRSHVFRFLGSDAARILIDDRSRPILAAEV